MPGDTSTRDLQVRVEAVSSPEVQALIRESQVSLLTYLPPEEIFSLNAEEMTAPNITVFVARKEGQAMGCVALVDDTRYGEVKRLFVRDGARRMGVAVALMSALERYCHDIGLLEVRLETSPALAQAVRLYETLGYRPRGPFGDYPVLDSSLFMEKKLGILPGRETARA